MQALGAQPLGPRPPALLYPYVFWVDSTPSTPEAHLRTEQMLSLNAMLMITITLHGLRLNSGPSMLNDAELGVCVAIISLQVSTITFNYIAMQDLSKKIEDQGKDLGKRIEDQGKKIEDQGKKIEDQGKDLGKKIEDQGKDLGKRIEDQGKDLGKRIEDQGKDLGKRIEDQGKDLGKRIEDQGKKIEDQGKDLGKRIEDQGKDLGKKIEDQGKDLGKRIEDQGKDLGKKIEDQGKERQGELNATNQRINNLEIHLGRRDGSRDWRRDVSRYLLTNKARL
eukprot:scaffold1772_cov112-Isochrysis_galbana.AAC.4